MAGGWLVLFPLATSLAFVVTLGLLAWAVRHAGAVDASEERRFVAFKRIRLGTYGALTALQAALIAARQFEHWPALDAVDGDGALVATLYAATLVRRCGPLRRRPRLLAPHACSQTGRGRPCPQPGACEGRVCGCAPLYRCQVARALLARACAALP